MVFKSVKVTKNKESKETALDWRRPRRHDSFNQCKIQDWILEQEKDINGVIKKF